MANFTAAIRWRRNGAVFALHAEAHGECFIANSVKTEIVCKPTIVR